MVKNDKYNGKIIDIFEISIKNIINSLKSKKNRIKIHMKIL